MPAAAKGPPPKPRPRFDNLTFFLLLLRDGDSRPPPSAAVVGVADLDLGDLCLGEALAPAEVDLDLLWENFSRRLARCSDFLDLSRLTVLT